MWGFFLGFFVSCLLFHSLVAFKKSKYTPCALNRAITFDSVQSAQRAKASLNGADIYSGCCTLKIEYAKVTPANKIS